MPMLKKLLKFVVLILVLVGIFYGIMLTIEKSNPGKQLKKIEENYAPSNTNKGSPFIHSFRQIFLHCKKAKLSELQIKRYM